LKNITKEFIQNFVNNHEFELSSTQTKLCVPIINRIFKKMSAGIKFSSIKVENNFICDGHHRYIASILASFFLERTPSSSTSATEAVDWKSVIFEENEWDAPELIDFLNRQDAEFNDIPVEKILELLK
jgi:hypothetical protein